MVYIGLIMSICYTIMYVIHFTHTQHKTFDVSIV